MAGGKYEVLPSFDDGEIKHEDTNATKEPTENRTDEENTSSKDFLLFQDRLSYLTHQYITLLLGTSICLFAFSLVFLAFSYHNAPSDKACERKHWAYSIEATDFLIPCTDVH